MSFLTVGRKSLIYIKCMCADIYRRSPRPGPLPYAAMNPMSFYGPRPGQHRRVSRKAPGPFRRVR